MRGRNIVLHGISLRVEADEHVAILGPNGCGKSTLVKTITRECYPLAENDSSMRIFGQESWDVFRLRGHLGVVSNDWMQVCTSEASGLDVVLSGFFSSTDVYSNHKVEPAQRELARAALARLDVAQLADRAVCEMSSGEARRVLIARALVHNPQALVFDEPCNSLDFTAQRIVRQTMSTLARAGVAIVLVTHELADIVPEIERVVLMKAGSIIADGQKHDILRSERLSQLFGAPVKIARQDGHYHIG